MGWELRHGRRYLYRNRRVNGKQVKEYFENLYSRKTCSKYSSSHPVLRRFVRRKSDTATRAAPVRAHRPRDLFSRHVRPLPKSL